MSSRRSKGSHPTMFLVLFTRARTWAVSSVDERRASQRGYFRTVAA